MTNKLWLFKLGYLAVIFLKMNELSLSHQEKQLIMIANNKKAKLSGKNTSLGKFVSATVSWVAPNI